MLSGPNAPCAACTMGEYAEKQGRNFEQFIKFCELVRICVLRTPFGMQFAATHAILPLPDEMYSS